MRQNLVNAMETATGAAYKRELAKELDELALRLKQEEANVFGTKTGRRVGRTKLLDPLVPRGKLS